MIIKDILQRQTFYYHTILKYDISSCHLYLLILPYARNFLLHIETFHVLTIDTLTLILINHAFTNTV
jgi:hypothetical protein